MIDVDVVNVANGDITIEVATVGDGPLVVFVHGWPELWISWRHQMQFVADRGYRAAALNVRGYGGSSNPTEVEAYTMREIAGDVAAVIDALGDGEPAVIVGHDWGAPIVWNTARLHPGRVRAVMGMSVPYLPIGPTSSLEIFRELYADRFFYQLYFQQPGVAEAELGADHGRSLRLIFHGASAASAAEAAGLAGDKPAYAGLLDGMVDPGLPLGHLTDEEFAVYVEAYQRSGWHGPINRYRAQDLDAADIGHLDDDGVLTQPAAFVGGELDGVRFFIPGLDLFDLAPRSCADWRGTTIVPGAGHWVQQERPAETNAALGEFLDSL